MKSLSFKRKGSSIRVMPEPTLRKHYNWDRLVYLVFLLVLFGFLLTWGLKKLFYIEANGQIMFENVEVRILNDCRVLNYYIYEDDTVKIGDTLFMYVERNQDNNGLTADIDGSSIDNRFDWVIREIYALRKKIAVNNTEILEKNKQARLIEKELPAMKNQVILDAMPLSRLDARQNELNQLRSDVERIKAENTELNNLIGSLKPLVKKQVKPKTANGNYEVMGTGADDENIIKYYLSPIEGSVNRIFTRQFETALRQEVVMSIHKNSPIYVRTFFNQEDLAYFHTGDEVQLRFPDGSESKGIVRRFYYSTIALPEEFQKRYEPTQRTIAADVYPADTLDRQQWRTFYKMSVEIKRFKY